MVLTQYLDTARALQFLESAAMVLKSASETWELSEKTLKAIKIVKVVGEVLAVVSLIVDGIILIIAAIEGAKQRTALEEYVAFPEDETHIWYLMLTTKIVQYMILHIIGSAHKPFSVLVVNTHTSSPRCMPP